MRKFTELELAGLSAAIRAEELLQSPRVGSTFLALGVAFDIVALEIEGGAIKAVLGHDGQHYMMTGWTEDSDSSWAEYSYRNTNWDGELTPAALEVVSTTKWVAKAVDSWDTSTDGWGYSSDTDSWDSWS